MIPITRKVSFMNFQDAQGLLKPGTQIEKEIRVLVGRTVHFVEIDEVVLSKDGKVYLTAIVTRSIKPETKPRQAKTPKAGAKK